MERVFLDANVLFSAGYKSTRLRILWTLTDVTLLSSEYAVREAELNLSRFKPEAVEELNRLLKGVTISPQIQLPPLPANIALVEKDAPILQAAIGVQATHLLTGDVKHFGHLFGVTVEGVLILPPAEYLKGKE
ncbi:MAG: PIN domain-containing protein [Microcystis sp.]|jgi:predicted nucleic acid-binding protein|uniref:PIN domain-containing protein n=1 Tax=Microcystis TaxID=1125 RepID=UPI0022456398|nr:PIN domain-containing protein [Microcystis aeruginosa]NCQ93631.1 PIN domain-containing protein [Microcystis aeruginosa LG13-13]NCR06747.1 PIN domain-containing protein [Microcystis aeruginosa LG13-03]NCR64939.1 PIN domain-containing protein [Microcystis aeruginosa LG11-05]NCR73891.1 PIN domain-containing protein [Microcystis aeruginosa LG13-12]UZO77683.1 PIN domain-containing protein [Microcystis aeruginosa str. Chao 1910]